ncbi:hypothetical protein EYF80_061426 [Liparis tanakae]|uniref:Uncharacterized protein n=1 Tax=Liparis tanakae TaxID=230148 RepID=A0A4Z2EI32_9TELE|nr:hypothetical protein EYF80_061426 [Liparis tanakae]
MSRSSNASTHSGWLKARGGGAKGGGAKGGGAKGGGIKGHTSGHLDKKFLENKTYYVAFRIKAVLTSPSSHHQQVKHYN